MRLRTTRPWQNFPTNYSQHLLEWQSNKCRRRASSKGAIAGHRTLTVFRLQLLILVPTSRRPLVTPPRMWLFLHGDKIWLKVKPAAASKWQSFITAAERLRTWGMTSDVCKNFAVVAFETSWTHWPCLQPLNLSTSPHTAVMVRCSKLGKSLLAFSLPDFIPGCWRWTFTCEASPPVSEGERN